MTNNFIEHARNFELRDEPKMALTFYRKALEHQCIEDAQLIDMMVILFMSQDYEFCLKYDFSDQEQSECREQFKYISSLPKLDSECLLAESKFWSKYFCFIFEGGELPNDFLDNLFDYSDVPVIGLSVDEICAKRITEFKQLYDACKNCSTCRERYLMSVLRGLISVSKGRIIVN